MPVNQITIPQPGTANNAPASDGTPGPYQTSSTLVPNPGKADGKLGTGSNATFIPSSTPVPNPREADGEAGTGSNAVFIPGTTPVPNPTKADGQLGTGSNVTFVPSRSNTGITYVPNPNAADGTDGTTPTPPPPSNPPAAPVATAGTSLATTSFLANWGAVSGAASYRLDVSTVNTFVSFVSGFNNLTVAGTSQSVTGLSGGTSYFYRVRAVNSDGTSSNSNTITVLTVPAAPIGLAGTNVTTTTIDLTWNASTGATSYRLDVSTDPAFGSFVPGYNNLIVNAVPSKQVTGLTGGTVYYSRVRAVNVSGTSANSDTYGFQTLSSLLVDLTQYYVMSIQGGFIESLIMSSDKLGVNGTIIQDTSDVVVLPGTDPADYLDSTAGDGLWTFDFPLSVSMWFLPLNPYGTVMGRWSISDPSGSQWRIFLGSLDLFLNLTDSDGSDHTYPASTSVSDSSFNLVVITYSSDLNVYLNGQLYITVPDWQLNGSINAAFRVGSTFDGAELLNMGLADVATWQRELTQEEVTALWNNGTIFRYPF